MNDQPLEPMLLTKKQAAQLTGLCVRTLNRLIARGILRQMKPSGLRCVRMSRAELVEWIENGCPVERGRRVR